MTQSSTLAPARILVCDDEAFIREAMSVYLEALGFEIVSVADGTSALAAIESTPIEVAILDIDLPGIDGLTVLGRIKQTHPDLEVVISSGCGTIDSAIGALRAGAYDYVAKPILDFEQELLRVVEKALERRRLLLRNRQLSTDVRAAHERLLRSHARLASDAHRGERANELAALIAVCPDFASFHAAVTESTALYGATQSFLVQTDERGWCPLLQGRNGEVNAAHSAAASESSDPADDFDDAETDASRDIWSGEIWTPGFMPTDDPSIGDVSALHSIDLVFEQTLVGSLLVDRGRIDDAAGCALRAVIAARLARGVVLSNDRR